MKLVLLFCLVVLSTVTARPDNVLAFRNDDMSVSQDTNDDVITGSYSWTSPEGTQFYVRYIADDDGYRIVESNAIPISSSGVKANGRQGSFLPYRYDDDDFDHDSFEDHDDDDDDNDSDDDDDDDFFDFFKK